MPKTTKFYPGKYEGNHSQWLARIVSERDFEESFGDMDYGLWVGRIIGKKYVFYVVEDSQGFVDVIYNKINSKEDEQTYSDFCADMEEYNKWVEQEESNEIM